MKSLIDYTDIKNSIDRLLNDKESDEIEFKSAAGGFPLSFWETYSSFANTNGGTIIFGIKEKKNVFFLDGLTKDQVDKYRKDFFNNMHSKQNVSLPLLHEDDVEEVPIQGCYILLFYIPRVERNLRPVYCGQDPYTGTYRRDEDGDYHCTREEVNSMFADANIANPVDGRILEHYGIDDLDETSIKEYRQLFARNNPSHVWNSLSDEEFLEKLNVIRKDRTKNKKGLTFAGLLMFGTYSALTDEDPNFFPDYQEINNSKDRWINRICPDGNWESNLFQFYKRVLPILQSFLPKPFRLEGNLRVNETPAHVAVREALTNALVHADYTENASLNIYKYPNKIVLSNPGTMLISKSQYYKGGESICRNKYLQTMFTFLGAAEKAGSGADKIIHGWQEQNWLSPNIEEKARPNKVVLTMTMESLLDTSTLQGLQKMYGKNITSIDHHQLLVLALAYTEEEITNERLRYALDMHPSDITHLLADMCNKGLLETSGYGRGTKYHLTKRKIALNDSNVALGGNKVALNGSNVALDNGKVAHRHDKVALECDAIRNKKRYNTKELKQIISYYCTDWRSVEEIAKYINRNKEYVKNSVLSKLSDILERKYDIPHHPKQRYRIKKTN